MQDPDTDAELDAALADTFPASDPLALAPTRRERPAQEEQPMPLGGENPGA